ncbi:MAG: WYL domain-containing protein [Proteobacteria bacterium]|nr:WYL domain-containing protein [Pseudomonadota bacterium]MDA1330973.1 WYL domain-containing protein [Pseudomonadota bacterium]
MERTERFYKIDRLLRDNRSVPLGRFLEELSVSKATFKRDIEYMRDRLNAPISWDRTHRGYIFDQEIADVVSYELPGIWFNQSEILALLSMEALLSQIQPGLLGPRLDPLKQKLCDLIEVGEYSVDAIKNRIKILNMGSRSRSIKHFEVIALSLMQRSQLVLAYYVRSREEVTLRSVSPQRIVYYRDNWYLDAWCHSVNAVRSFSLDAVRSAKLKDEAAIQCDEKILDAVLGSGYGIFSGTDLLWAKLRFGPERAKWVSLEEWHPSQRTYFDDEGYFILEIPYAEQPELIMDILRFGPDVEVIEPASLRQMIREKVSEMLAIYE